jgi:hypothetical protein
MGYVCKLCYFDCVKMLDVQAVGVYRYILACAKLYLFYLVKKVNAYCHNMMVVVVK